MASSYRDRLRARSTVKATETVQEEDPTKEAATQKKVASKKTPTYKQKVRSSTSQKATETVQEEEPTQEAATQKKIKERTGTPTTLPTVSEFERSIESQEIGPQHSKSGDSTRALTSSQKQTFKQQHPEFYDSQGNFKGRTFRDDAEQFGIPEEAFGGVSVGFLSGLTGGKESDLDEDRFIRAYIAQEIERKKFGGALTGGAVGFVPVWGTIYHWENMSPNQRAVSILLDGVDILTLTKGFSLGGKFRGSKGLANAREFADDAIVTNMQKVNMGLTGDTKITMAAIKRAQAQGNYANAVIDLNQYEKGLGPSIFNLRGKLTGGGKTKAELSEAIEKTGKRLEDTTETLNEEIKKFEKGKPRDVQFEYKRRSGAETVADTRRQVNSLLDETGEIQTAETKLANQKEAIQTGLVKGYSNNDKALQIIKASDGLADLQKARDQKVKDIKARIDRLSNELEQTQNTGRNNKVLTDEITSLQKDIVSYSKTDFNAADSIYKTMRESIKTFPKDRSKWTPEMIEAALKYKALQTSRYDGLGKMEVIWRKGGDSTSRYDGGFDTTAPTKPKTGLPGGGTRVKPKPATNIKTPVGTPLSQDPRKKPQMALSKTESAVTASYFAPDEFGNVIETQSATVVQPAKPRPVKDPIETPIIVEPPPGSEPKPGTEPKTKTKTSPGTSPGTDPGAEPGTKTSTQTQTQTQAQTFFAPAAYAQAQAIAVEQATRPRAKTRTRTDTPTTPKERGGKYTPKAKGGSFELPGGKKLPPGVFPEIVEHEQGAVDIQTNLVTGKRKYFGRAIPSTRSPKETLKVISTSPVKPKKQNWLQGLFRMDVTSNSLKFSRSRGG
tara:strand:+ start:689 stop:3205 length:2517 start_codon:yes stop_codon:yes gene_type:complete